MNCINGFDFVGELPREITIDILSRLPILTFTRSKLVSKAWHDVVESHGCVDAHLSKHEHECDTFFVRTSFGGSKAYKLSEEYGSSTTICRSGALAECKPLLPYSSPVKGLMLLLCPRSEVLFVCNPVTREFVRIFCPDPFASCVDLHPNYLDGSVSYGFGVSKKSKQYKLVYISGCCEYHVYTLGTGQWRVGPSPPIGNGRVQGRRNWASVDGKLYWVQDMVNICCFDLETEVFTSFPGPPSPSPLRIGCFLRRVCVLEECLCVCDAAKSSRHNVDMLIWIMKGEGDWSLVCRIPKDKHIYKSLPIKVLGKGNIILMASREGFGKRYYYDTNNTSTTQIGYGALASLYQQYTYACPFNPTFVSLKTLFQHQDKDIIHSF
ncbi:putative F-box protein At1g33530 [Salvia splendens]|uniref:putative F-box protein At1g33530 n=1 Tax=Salvia splendens TaxID=180675 RepID=UPI001C26B485|nr:putative F-box protein At1g33530 [Salvia splendens]